MIYDEDKVFMRQSIRRLNTLNNKAIKASVLSSP